MTTHYRLTPAQQTDLAQYVELDFGKLEENGNYCFDQDAYDALLNHYDIGTFDLTQAVSFNPDDEKLVIYRKLPEGFNPLISDFSILGFKKVGPSYSRGRKNESTYVDETDGKMAVRKTFSDITDNNGLLTAIQLHFEWFREDGQLGLEKTEVAREFNKIEAETVVRKRRERQLDFLIAGAKGTPIEPYIMAVFNHYHDEQLLYKEAGSSEFEDAVIAETDPTILGILDISVPRFDDPNLTIKVKDSILYQITGDVSYLT